MSKKKDGSKGGPRAGMTDEERAEEVQQMLHARRAGASYAAIARQFGLNVKTVHEKITAALRDMPKDEAAELRMLEAQKLDYAETRLAGAIKVGDVKAINALVRISESRRKLLGLDMPEQHEVKISREEESLIDQLAAALTERAERERREDDITE